MMDLRKLQNALLREDVRGAAKELFRYEECGICEDAHVRIVRCSAPGCTFRACADCVLVHQCMHVYDDNEGRTQ